MGKIKAIIADPALTERLTIREVDSPALASNQALVQVKAFSLNRGEVMRAFRQQEVTQPGWDLAGIVAQPAADGSGPQAGARVVGLLRSGAWAERVGVPTNALAVLPVEVSFQQAATLPVAGLTALLALDKGAPLLGRKVLVTGASGGVGDFAVQLARQSGAYVVGLVSQSRYTDSVLKIGAHQVVASADGSSAAQFGPYDLIADALGGRALSIVFTQLAQNGICITYSSGLTGTDVAFSSRSVPAGARLYFLLVFQELLREPASFGLGRLAQLVADGKLHPTIEVEASWKDIAGIAKRLIDRDYSGKAVLTID
jgi:NADPH:quinone reductase-like Zn-dependent oxidoreductase